MKILFIQDSLGSGGAERSNAELWYFLRNNSVEIKIVILDRISGGIEEEIFNNNLDVIFLNKKNFINESFQIANIIKEYKPSIVHSVLFNSSMRVRFAKFKVKFFHLESLVNTTYSKERFEDKKVNQYALQFYKFLDKITASKGVNHFHSITCTVKEHYIEEINLKPENVTVIPRGRKPLYKTYDEKYAKVNRIPQLINVGRHEFQKGQIHLLKALKILKNNGYEFHLKILGRKGAVTSELENYINDNYLQDVVTLEGFKTNVLDYLLASDLFVFPSLYEGLGGALIEAQAAGMPIACNNIPVLHEVVIEDVNCKFFDVHKVDTIVEAINFFLDNPIKLEEYGRESLLNYHNKFDLETNNRGILDLYRELVKS